MTDFLYMMSQAKLAEYYDTRTDLPIRKYVLIANMLRKSTTQKEDRAEEQWLDTCLDALDKQEDKTEDQWLETFLDALGEQEDTLQQHDDAKKQAITLRHYSLTSPTRHKQQKLILAPPTSSSSSSTSSQQQDFNIYQIVLS